MYIARKKYKINSSWLNRKIRDRKNERKVTKLYCWSSIANSKNYFSLLRVFEMGWACGAYG